jgi:glycosyltransferase involved in cell wall biosynthesis
MLRWLLTPAHFVQLLGYLKKERPRFWLARILFLLSPLLALRRSTPSLTFQPPFYRIGRRPISPGCLPMDVPVLTAALRDELSRATATIKDGLAGRLRESPTTPLAYPEDDPAAVYDRLLLEATRKLAQCRDAGSAGEVLRLLRDEITPIFGPLSSHHVFSRLELLLGLRKMRVGIYDHVFHLVGGGQRYTAFMAERLKEKYDVTYIANQDASLEQYREWFDIDLTGCKLRIVRIPALEGFGWSYIDEDMVLNKKRNPFDVISEESLRYDVFINANMLTKVQPLSPVSVFVCHFPDHRKGRFFAADRYDYIVSSSRYGTGWIKEKWGLEATHLIYPPVEMEDPESDPADKERTILSVSRFEPAGTKKQLEMAKAFIGLAESRPDIGRTWKLVLAGGSPMPNPYLEKIAGLAGKAGSRIELMPNLSHGEVRALYKSASLFWHACGLDQTDPGLVEHFGMTTVEAMQNYCVPIVIRGGGQLEIVQDGVSGFTFATIAELQERTLTVIDDEPRRMDLARKAYLRSREFNGRAFTDRAAALFSEIEGALMAPDAL